MSEIIIPKLLQEGCVLQRGENTRIWGWYQEGETVVVQIQDQSITCTCGKDGYFEGLALLQKTGGPFTLTILQQNKEILYQNKEVYVGDLYICSGQSNVELPMSRVRERFPKEAGMAEVHEYKVEEDPEFHVPLTDHRRAYWRACVGEDLEKVTATGFFFAKYLQEAEKVPIGIINISKGGTPIQAWMGRDALFDYPDILKLHEQFEDDQKRDKFLKAQAKAENHWHEELRKREWQEKGEEPFLLQVPSLFEEYENLRDFCGLLYIKRSFRVNDADGGKAAVLRMGTMLDSDEIYVNGTLVGQTPYCYPPRIYRIPEGVLQSGENEILIRLEVWRGLGRITKEKPHRITIEDGTEIDLNGQWEAKVMVRSGAIPETEFMIYKPTVMFQGMTAPCFPMTVKGVVWYQGESNDNDADRYQIFLKRMIENWRAHFKQEKLPFIIAQLPACGIDNYGHYSWAKIREAQRKVSKELSDVSLVVTLDTGEWNDLHPLNKKELGRRLALSARHFLLGEDCVAEGPVLLSAKAEKGKAILSFDTKDGSMLQTWQGEASDSLEIADKAGNYRKPEKVTLVKNTIEVEDEICKENQEIWLRYAWSDAPLHGLLKNESGLFASPFQIQISKHEKEV